MIPALQEAEVGGSQVQDQSGQFGKTLSQSKQSNKDWGWAPFPARLPSMSKALRPTPSPAERNKQQNKGSGQSRNSTELPATRSVSSAANLIKIVLFPYNLFLSPKRKV